MTLCRLSVKSGCGPVELCCTYSTPHPLGKSKLKPGESSKRPAAKGRGKRAKVDVETFADSSDGGDNDKGEASEGGKGECETNGKDRL